VYLACSWGDSCSNCQKIVCFPMALMQHSTATANPLKLPHDKAYTFHCTACWPLHAGSPVLQQTPPPPPVLQCQLHPPAASAGPPTSAASCALPGWEAPLALQAAHQGPAASEPLQCSSSKYTLGMEAVCSRARRLARQAKHR
jgi:hypothetical protein